MRHRATTVARIAARQHGRITVEQLRDAGFDKYRVRRWVADGRLYAEHRGVYAVGHPGRSVLSDYMAAVLAAGSGAHLSHRPAAHLLRLIRGAPPPAEVTFAGVAARRRPGIRIHRVRKLHRLDVARHDGIPVTIVPRILLDLAPSLAPAALTRACHEAWIHHRAGPREIEACIARNPNKPGAAKLRAAVGADVTLSALEDRFLVVLQDHAIELPRTNVDHGGDKVDCHWPHLGLTIELLSFRFHGTRQGFEQDVARRRRSHHVAFTYGDVFERSAATAAEVAAVVERARANLSAAA
ncbi:MAG TPA: type IV toxin-antitoxin system AbiEi family antitoxin domain-containing protein [Solirubrobacteraceae bacterium]|nr:type IV toxin-antitoxin system AbiEi family antitoxin domain-containing protein [Solirubrobacteraceae bacterium]